MAEDAASTSASFFSCCREGRDRYTVLEVIGRGSYGTVCSAVDRLTGQKVAIKRVQNVFDNVADAQRILREIMLLRLLKNPDVVEIKHIMLPEDPRRFKDLHIVFELMESDLHTVIGANDDLTPDHHRVFLYQLLRGLAFIHEAGVLHRDLKPKNILANSNCKLTICDLGLARPMFVDTPAATVLTDYVATRWYRAPELCGCFYGTYTQAVDVWSIGCIFAETLLGKPLFPGRDAVSQLNLITDLLGKPAPHVIEGICNPKARAFLHAMPPKPAQDFEHRFRNGDHLGLDLLRHLLAFDPSMRPTAAEALLHPYFEGLPPVAPANIAPISRLQFEFEMHQLSEADVRELIYLEALKYHPEMLHLFVASGHVMPPLLAQLDINDSSGLRQQFLLADQYGPGHDGHLGGQYPARQHAQQMAAAAAAAVTAVPQVQPAAVLQADPHFVPHLAAAMAAAEQQEQQQQLALMRQAHAQAQALQYYAASAALDPHIPPTGGGYPEPTPYATTSHILATEC